MRARRCHGVEEQQQRGVTEAGVEAEAETESNKTKDARETTAEKASDGQNKVQLA